MFSDNSPVQNKIYTVLINLLMISLQEKQDCGLLFLEKINMISLHCRIVNIIK